MILKRNNGLNIQQIREDLAQVPGLTQQPKYQELEQLLTYYFECTQAADATGTRLEILDADYQFRYAHNPIHHMEQRIKDVSSLIEKLTRKQVPFTYEAVKNEIFDIAGIRVVTNYRSDVEVVANALLAHKDVELLHKRDYIAEPKESGYRSLHLVLLVPFYETDGQKKAPVEVQIRTIGMDMWASLEHKLRYKSKTSPAIMAQYSAQLTHYADEIEQIERGMETLSHALNGFEA
ncbi:MAG: GTP pyrophosphokinase family protein [Aerococcus sp.]|nr:GTP pyrophosphokinase family protein [Aerococcus sp.]